MLGELDFRLEAKNLAEFRAFLEANALTGVATAPVGTWATESKSWINQTLAYLNIICRCIVDFPSRVLG